MEEKCEKCYYFVSNSADKKSGNCHRYPPQIEHSVFGKWPLTTSDGWCGEFKPKEKKDEESR